MNIIIFLIILAVLVLVHEFGHFIVAKKSGVRVDEFGLGFPPRIFGKKIGETVYSLNLLPFGGFVKIFGENAESLEVSEGVYEDPSRSLAHKSKLIQAAVLGAGVSFNVLFAWLVISLGLVFGLPTVVDSGNLARVSDARVVVSSVAPGSPAEVAGLKPGDFLLSLSTLSASLDSKLTPDGASEFIRESNEPIGVSYQRGAQIFETEVSAKEGVVPGRKAVGINMEQIGILKLPVHEAIGEGGARTAELFKAVAISIFYFLRDAVFGRADFSEVAGPVGMVALVGDARDLGFNYLVFFTALLSLNLAVINLIPFPALDGGRLIMVLIEALKGSPIKPKIVQAVNTAGFALLILLMVVVTYKDIVKIF